MSIQLTRRIAARQLRRGESKVRIKTASVEDAKKAMTTDDVRVMIKEGKIYAIPEKHNVSRRAKSARAKKMKGRRSGSGSRRGTTKARMSVDYKKRVRGQRRVLKILKKDKVIDNETFKRFYLLVKGGTFESKGSLISHMKGNGVKLEEEQEKKLRHA
ncbi:MAG TPA: 50S ribosomal protein L19e [Candidatus Acidoferrum sp.]|nr:50S ribosomal protein L19e [Candidatus Acidoferrum sp.]